MTSAASEKMRARHARRGTTRRTCDKEGCKSPLKPLKPPARERVLNDYVIEFYAECPKCKCRYGRQVLAKGDILALDQIEARPVGGG